MSPLINSIALLAGNAPVSGQELATDKAVIQWAGKQSANLQPDVDAYMTCTIFCCKEKQRGQLMEADSGARGDQALCG